MPRNNNDPNTSEAIALAAADSGSTTDVLAVGDGQKFDLSDIKVHYDPDATGNCTLELYDEPEGTASADVSDLLDHFFLTPGANLDFSGLSRKDVEESIVALPTAAQDGDIYLTVGGKTTSI